MILYPGVKINLGLNILRKRPDGFHDLETLFVPVSSVHDTLEVVHGEAYAVCSESIRRDFSPEQRVQAVSPDGKLMITIARKEGVDWDPLKDLCARAYFLLAEQFKLPPVKILLQKGSPVGAGLGGGSADAAFTLRAVSELCGLGLSDAELARYAARLGSDCAFFVYNRPMFASGRGEVLEEYDLCGGPAGTLPFRVELVMAVSPRGSPQGPFETFSAIRNAGANSLSTTLSHRFLPFTLSSPPSRRPFTGAAPSMPQCPAADRPCSASSATERPFLSAPGALPIA